MSATIQPELIPATDPNWKPAKDELAVVTPMSLMQVALDRGQVEQLQILQDMYFKDLARKAEVEFNLAMNAAQAEIQRIVPNAYNSETKSKWATYAQLDAVLRPVYIKHGFSLSFDSGEPAVPETVRAYCYVSHTAGHTRKYQSPDMPLPTKGAKGGAVMTATHGTGAAMSYAMRYLLKYIFNIAVGEDDTDGNPPMSGADADALQEWKDSIMGSASFEELQARFTEAYRANDNQTARDAIIAAKDKRRGELRKAGAR